MPFLNIEIKAKVRDPSFVRNYLLQNRADFKGTDFQTDTYFNVQKGRLKLREGDIETNLIFYERNNEAGPKSSYFQLAKVADPMSLKKALESALGIKVIVKKKREIYYIGNVKFHIDEVPGLGSFVEIEAGNLIADLSQAQLKAQCDFYLNEFNIEQEYLIAESYSDLLMK